MNNTVQFPTATDGKLFKVEAYVTEDMLVKIFLDLKEFSEYYTYHEVQQ